MPYAQKVVSDYLRGQLNGVRVVSNPPPEASRDEPWVQPIQHGATHNSWDITDKVTGFYFQFSCYAGSEGGFPEAERLGRKVASLINTTVMQGKYDAPTEDDDPVVVSLAQVENGPFSLPDTDGFEPARDRFLVDTVIHMHTIQ